MKTFRLNLGVHERACRTPCSQYRSHFTHIETRFWADVRVQLPLFLHLYERPQQGRATTVLAAADAHFNCPFEFLHGLDVGAVRQSGHDLRNRYIILFSNDLKQFSLNGFSLLAQVSKFLGQVE